MESNYKLIERVRVLSYFSEWEDIKKEWVQLRIIYRDYDDPGQCLCGKFPIREEIILFNNLTKNEISVGNCCIKKFFEISDFDKVFKALKKNKVNEFMIIDSYNKGLLSSWEYNFMLDVWRKRNKTYKQSEIFDKIKDKIIKNYKKNKEVTLNGK